ncbi:MAG: MFS transporter [Opitutaceae bacterium]|nr:MFS transporter [Opitutaceae bacterium]
MPRSSALLLVIIYLGFISLGLPDGTLGVAWPAIFPELKLPVGFAGTILLVITLLAGASGFSSGWILARFHTGPVVLASGVLTGCALVAISQAPSMGLLLLAAVPLGLGAGAVDAGLNSFVARHYDGRHMNWLHASWGIGATCGPLVIGEALATHHGWRGGYLVLGFVQLGLAGLFLATLRLWSLVPERPLHGSPGRNSGGSAELAANSPAGWLSPAVFALYTGIEASTGLWAATVLSVNRGMAPEVAAWCAAGYYAAITGGRIAVGFVVDRWGNRRVISLGVLLAFTGALLLALGRGTLGPAAGLVLVGLGLAPVYPGLMHEVPHRFTAVATPTVIGRQSGAAGLGVAFLPPMLGLLAAHALAAIPWVVAAAIAGLWFAIRWLDRMTARKTPPAVRADPT